MNYVQDVIDVIDLFGKDGGLFTTGFMGTLSLDMGYASDSKALMAVGAGFAILTGIIGYGMASEPKYNPTVISD